MHLFSKAETALIVLPVKGNSALALSKFALFVDGTKKTCNIQGFDFYSYSVYPVYPNIIGILSVNIKGNATFCDIVKKY